MLEILRAAVTSALGPGPSLCCKDLEVKKSNKPIKCSWTTAVFGEERCLPGLGFRTGQEFLGRSWSFWPSLYDWSNIQKSTSPKAFHGHFVKYLWLGEGKKMWTVLFLLNCPSLYWDFRKGVRVENRSKHGQRGHPWSLLDIFLRMFTLFLFLIIRIPGNLLFSLHSCCKIPLGVSHSPLVPKKRRINFFSECAIAGCGKWHRF